jgi:hypothetical protein
VVSE